MECAHEAGSQSSLAGTFAPFQTMPLPSGMVGSIPGLSNDKQEHSTTKNRHQEKLSNKQTKQTDNSIKADQDKVAYDVTKKVKQTQQNALRFWRVVRSTRSLFHGSPPQCRWWAAPSCGEIQRLGGRQGWTTFSWRPRAPVSMGTNTIVHYECKILLQTNMHPFELQYFQRNLIFGAMLTWLITEVKVS